jgi:hypothetical protein
VRRWLLLTCVCALVCAGVASAKTSPLNGVFETKIAGKTGVLNGTWLISFAPNGTYAVVKEPNTSTLLIGGSSAVSGSKVSMVDKAGPLACKSLGTYSWSLSRKTLRLTRVKDTCAGRVAVLSSTAYTKVQ